MSFWISAFVVAFGQYAWLAFCAPLAASLGFAIHWKQLEKRSSWKLSFLWFFVIQLIQLSWLTDTTYQGIYIIFVYVILCAFMAGQFAVLSAFIKKQQTLSWKIILAMAGFWTLMEWVRFHVLCGFPFNLVGLSLTCNPYSIRFASLLGVLGLSFWVIITNLVATRYFKEGRSRKFLLQWALVALIPYLWGMGSMFFSAQQSEDDCSVLLVQTGLLPSEKYKVYGRESEYIHPVIQWENILEEISLYKDKKVDLLVLPEAAVPMGLDRYVYDPYWIQKILKNALGSKVEDCFPKQEAPFGDGMYVSNSYIAQTICNFFDAQLIMGLDRETPFDNYNSVLSFQKDHPCEIYDKRVLLPIAEYIPFSWMKKYGQAYGITGFFSQGKEGKVLGKYRVFPSVCYEELFPALMQEAKGKGAKLFVNVSNDGWFPSSRLAKQHFSQGMLRAVENGIPLLHTSARGITAIVDSNGVILDQAVENARESIYRTVALSHKRTLFSLIGEAPFIILCALLTCRLSAKRSGVKKVVPI